MRRTGKQQSTTSFWVAGCILLSIGLIVVGLAVWRQLHPAERPSVASSARAADAAAVASAYSASPAPQSADLATPALPARATESQAPNASAVAAGTPDAAPADSVRLPADMHGEEAITALGDKLADVAAAHQMSAEALRNELRKDSDLWVGDGGQLFYACTMLKEPASAKDEPAKVGNSPVRAAADPATVEADTVDTNGNITSTTPLMDTNWTFRLSSRPGASKTIYLDFTGHTTSNTSWNSSSMGGVSGSFYSPPYDTDGNPASFSSAEHAMIQQVWQQVAEDYAPFDVNVTTLEPPTNWLMKSVSGDTNWGIRVVITSYGPDSSAVGGIAVMNSFNSAKDMPCFVYNKSFAGMAEACSHEAGHTLGLSHDGTSANAYYYGHGSGETSWAPIMGVGYNINVSTWDNGVYFDANNGGATGNSGKGPEDMTVITNYNGFGFRQDTIGNSLTSATPLTVSSGAVGQFGTIRTRLDKHVFSFQLTTAGSVNLTVDPYWYRAFVSKDGVWGSSNVFTYTAPVTPARANLDVSVDLYNAAGVLLASANPAGLAATLSCSGLPAGTYFLQVDGVGFGTPTNNPPTGYTDYGSVGNYWISGTISNAVTPGNQAPTITAQPTNVPVTSGQTALFSVTATGSAPLTYQWYKNNAVIGGATAASYTTPATTSSDNGAAFKVTVSNAVGMVTSSAATLTVNPLPTYVVTYNANGATGAVPSSQIKTQDVTLVLASNSGALAKTGYTFAGWNTAANGSGSSYAAGASYTNNAAVTLYAAWTALPTYTVTYNANGATGAVPSSQIKTNGVTLTLASNSGALAKTGYTFAGWNTAANGIGTSYAAGASYTTNAAVTLYAAWTALPTYTVTYNANGATGAVPSSQIKTQDVTLVLASNSGALAKTGYTFAGWNTAANGSGSSYAAGASYTNNAAVTLYAAWTALPTYTVTYNANGATGAVPSSQIKTQDVTLVLASNSGALAKTGYTFAGWNTAANGSGSSYAAGASYTNNAAVTLYAAWTALPTYAVTYNANGATGAVPSSQIKTQDVTLVLASNSGTLAKTGYTFAGWNTAANGSGSSYAAGASYTNNAAVTLYAAWTALPTYAVTYNANGATGAVPSSQIKTQDVALVLASNSGVLVKSGYTFAGWNTAANGSGTSYAAGASYTTNAAVTLYAAWTALPTYAVTYNANGATSGTVPTSQIKTQDVALVLASNSGALAKSGYTFAGWNTAANGSGTSYAAGASYTANAAVTLYAAWTALPTYAVTYNANGATSGTVTTSQIKTNGVTLTLASNSGVLARTGYTFAGWNTAANGSGTSYAAGASYTANAAVTLYAVWTVLPTYAVTYNANGATSGTVPTSQNKTQDVALVLASNSGALVKSGYTFAGWNTAANGSGTSYAAGASYTTNAAVTLYAAWTALPTYAVTYNANGATGAVPSSQIKTQDVVLVLASNSGVLVKSGYTFAGWNTAANGSGSSYAAGASYTNNAAVTLYAAWTAVGNGVSATGGAVTNYTQNGINYRAHIFTNGGSLVVSSGGQVEYLVVAGGGGAGGRYEGGGGGAGGLLTGTSTIGIGSYAITVGAGGRGANRVVGSALPSNGGDSSIQSVATAIGGGYGAETDAKAAAGGGSGGGAAHYLKPTGGAGTSGQGNRGGNRTEGVGGCGGGGAGGQGTDRGNAGGPGVASSMSGSFVTYANGGNGQNRPSSGSAINGSDGAATTGNGGNGGGNVPGTSPAGMGGYGGSGIVIVRYVVGGGAPNQAPTAMAQSVTTAEDTDKAITLTGGDPEGSNLTYTVVSNPAHGTLSGTAPNVTYTPDANYNGADSFTFRASDGKTNSNVATVSITVTSVNDAPVAMAGVDPAVGSITDEFYFWATDSYDVDGTITGREWQINGTVVSTNAEFLYTFATGGAYTVTLTVWDNEGASGSDSVEVNVSEPITPVVSVSVLDGVAGEPGLALGSGRFQVSRIGDLTTAITVNYAMSGTASNGVDYTQVSGTVTLGAGVVSRTVVVDPLADALVEGTEWAILSLADGTGYVVDEELSAGAVMIQDQTYGTPTVTAVATDAFATEPGLTTDKGSIKISRTGSCDAALTVLVAVSGTAVNGVDYFTLTVPVVLAVGQNAKTLAIVPLADGVVESSETVTLTIQANAAYVIGEGQAAATVTIQDNTQLATPTVSVVATDPNAAEPGALVNTGTFTFRRTSRFHETLVMNCPIGGTASNGTDYNTASGAVTFPAGVATKTLTIIPKADGVTEGSEAVVMTIQASAAYAIEAGKSAATVTISE